MKYFIQHLLLVALLIVHVSSGSMTVVQMESSNMTSTHVELDVPENSIASTDNKLEFPCPDHAKTMSAIAVEDTQTISDTGCCYLDDSNCNCVNVLSTAMFLTQMLDHFHIDTSHDLVFIPTVFPDSPLTSILRPPIS